MEAGQVVSFCEKWQARVLLLFNSLEVIESYLLSENRTDTRAENKEI